MPKTTIISEGKTTNEAIENGLKELKVSKDQVDIKVIDSEDKRSFFSILAPRVVKVELTVKEEKEETQKKEKKVLEPLTDEEKEIAKNNLKTFLDQFIKAIKEDAKYSISEEDNRILVNLEGKDLGFMIGYRGETLYDFQNILSAIANKNINKKVSIILDIEGYKEKREKTLEELAEKVAKTVVKTRKSVTLEPMKAYERKIIHSKLQENDKVTTRSIGEEPRRRIVISLK